MNKGQHRLIYLERYNEAFIYVVDQPAGNRLNCSIHFAHLTDQDRWIEHREYDVMKCGKCTIKKRIDRLASIKPNKPKAPCAKCGKSKRRK